MATTSHQLGCCKFFIRFGFQLLERIHYYWNDCIVFAFGVCAIEATIELVVRLALVSMLSWLQIATSKRSGGLRGRTTIYFSAATVQSISNFECEFCERQNLAIPSTKRTQNLSIEAQNPRIKAVLCLCIVVLLTMK